MPEAVALATTTRDGAPSVRMVLLKSVDERGFVFFTNYGSRKASELEKNPQAALCFHWAELERQVRVTGAVERISEDESYAYFSSRGRGSRIGAWASQQSRPLPDRAELEERVREAKERFSDDDIPLPAVLGRVPHTSRDDRILARQGRPSPRPPRLHPERRRLEYGATLPLVKSDNLSPHRQLRSGVTHHPLVYRTLGTGTPP